MDSTPLASAASAQPRSSKAALWIGLWSILCIVVFGGGFIGMAVLIPTVAKVQKRARATVDQSNLRQVVQGALIWSSEHDSQLPPVHLTPSGNVSQTTFATIHGVAAALARDGGLNEASIWSSASDQMDVPETEIATIGPSEILTPDRKSVRREFAEDPVIAWDFATGLDLTMPPTTPVAWTRGLGEDGTWDSVTSVYGDEGGYIAFLGGNVIFYRDLHSSPLTAPDGSPTSNIIETLPTTVRVVGAGPGTLHGSNGLAP